MFTLSGLFTLERVSARDQIIRYRHDRRIFLMQKSKDILKLLEIIKKKNNIIIIIVFELTMSSCPKFTGVGWKHVGRNFYKLLARCTRCPYSARLTLSASVRSIARPSGVLTTSQCTSDYIKTCTGTCTQNFYLNGYMKNTLLVPCFINQHYIWNIQSPSIIVNFLFQTCRKEFWVGLCFTLPTEPKELSMFLLYCIHQYW